MTTAALATPELAATSAGFELKLSHRGADDGHHYWLLQEGRAVAYSKVYVHATAAGPEVELCDIETRSDERSRGHAKRLLALMAEHHGASTVHHSGGYTPEGFAYIAKHVTRSGAPATEATYRPMTFIHSWDTLTPEYN